MTARQPPRPRKQRRGKQRALRKTVREVEKIANMLPGATPDNPIAVASSAVVEPQARGTPCIQCGGAVEIRGDNAASTPRGVLREVELGCRRCHTRRRIWFRVAAGPS